MHQGDTNWRARNQGIFICRWYVTLCKWPWKLSQKHLQLVNTFNKLAGYIIKSQKSVAFLYTNNKWTEKEIRETTPSTIAANNTISWGGDNTKQVKDQIQCSSHQNFNTILYRSWKDNLHLYIETHTHTKKKKRG